MTDAKRPPNAGEKEELEALLKEIDLLLRHVIFRIREKDNRIFKKQP